MVIGLSPWTNEVASAQVNLCSVDHFKDMRGSDPLVIRSGDLSFLTRFFFFVLLILRSKEFLESGVRSKM